jgi:hypothetical protein
LPGSSTISRLAPESFPLAGDVKFCEIKPMYHHHAAQLGRAGFLEPLSFLSDHPAAFSVVAPAGGLAGALNLAQNKVFVLDRAASARLTTDLGQGGPSSTRPIHEIRPSLRAGRSARG